jgi:nucleoside-diphosphate-sugar epimerase
MEHPFAGQRVLVVGGAGFVGANLVRELLAQGAAAILVVDNLLSAERANLPEADAVSFLEGSITDEAVLAALRDDLDYLFHLATFHGNQNSIQDPLADHANNLYTTLRLYERIRGFQRLKKVVYSGAGCTAAEKTFGPARATGEEDPVSLRHDSPYQISKLIGEMYSYYYAARHGLPVVVARFQNVYGPGEILGAGRWRGTTATVWRNVTPTFVYLAVKGRPLPVEGTGEATRDFIYVGDIVAGLLACASRGTAGQAYNLASGVETPIRDLARLVNELTGNRAPIEWRPQRAWDRSGKRFGSTAKAARDLDFTTRVPLEEGLRRTVAWTREKLPLIEACIQRHAAHMPA